MPASCTALPSSEYSGELYSPPYLFQGPRPTIDNLPQGSQQAFNAAFGVDVTSQEGGIARVVLLRPAALTHHFDSDQRYIELAFTGGGTTAGLKNLTVTAPPADYGPPGWYMLFVLELKTSGTYAGKLVPSVARFVKLS
jgi:hypothetical protein